MAKKFMELSQPKLQLNQNKNFMAMDATVTKISVASLHLQYIVIYIIRMETLLDAYKEVM